MRLLLDTETENKLKDLSRCMEHYRVVLYHHECPDCIRGLEIAKEVYKRFCVAR